MNAPSPSTPWWSTRARLRRFVADLAGGELAALRHEALLPTEEWPDALSFEDDLRMDSLELLHVAGVLADTLQMRRSGVEDYLLARRTLGDWVDIAATALAHWDARLTFRTSGSSGAPKPCPQDLATLEQEARELASLFAGRQRLLLAVPTHHIYGFLFGILLPHHLGLPPGRVSGIRARLPSTAAQHAQPGDLVVGHPLFWQQATAPGCRFGAGVEGVTSTAPCPDEVADAAVAAGLARLFQVYGATETGGLGWRTSARESYVLFRHIARDRAAPDALIRTLPGGETVGASPQDTLAWQGERRFLVGRRHDGAVQVGGVNVFPEQVRQKLLEHPAIGDAAVRLMRPEEGARLKAFVVPRGPVEDGGALLRELRDWIDAALPAPARPKALACGARIPRNHMGKPCDWDIVT